MLDKTTPRDPADPRRTSYTVLQDLRCPEACRCMPSVSVRTVTFDAACCRDGQVPPCVGAAGGRKAPPSAQGGRPGIQTRDGACPCRPRGPPVAQGRVSRLAGAECEPVARDRVATVARRPPFAPFAPFPPSRPAVPSLRTSPQPADDGARRWPVHLSTGPARADGRYSRDGPDLCQPLLWVDLGWGAGTGTAAGVAPVCTDVATVEGP